MYQRHHDSLLAFASAEPFREELLASKRHYFARTGEVFEDDRSFEMRMASFLDFYLFDWPIDGRTPAQRYLDAQQALPPEEQELVQGFTRTRHSLWQVRKLGRQLIRLHDCFSGEPVEVCERREPAALSRGDLLEARLVPIGPRLFFSQSFCYHPREVKSAVLGEIERLKKAEPSFCRREFLFGLAKMRLKLERYRNVAAGDIYAFGRRDP